MPVDALTSVSMPPSPLRCSIVLMEAQGAHPVEPCLWSGQLELS